MAYPGSARSKPNDALPGSPAYQEASSALREKQGPPPTGYEHEQVR
jgi:hypothetical protein